MFLFYIEVWRSTEQINCWSALLEFVSMWWRLKLEFSSVVFTSRMTQIVPDVWCGFASVNCRDRGAQAKANQQTCSHSIFNPTWMAGKQGHVSSGQFMYLVKLWVRRYLFGWADFRCSLITKHYKWCRLENVLLYGGAQILRLFCIPTNLPILLSQR